MRSSKDKTLDATSTPDLKAKVGDVKVAGNPDAWQLVCKASSESQGWMKSTKAMEVSGLGVLVQVSTQRGDHVAEALCMVAGATIARNPPTGLATLVQSGLIERFAASVSELLDEKDERTARGKRAAKKTRRTKRASRSTRP